MIIGLKSVSPLNPLGVGIDFSAVITD